MIPKKIILVVDDEEDLLEIVRSHLEENYQVVTARSGPEGLEKAQQVKPRLIILDIAMPGMNGLEMLERLRGMPGLSVLPVVMLTAQGQTGNIFEADRLRVVDFLIKPFTRDELLHAVQKIL